MNEIIHVQIGQAGNYLSRKFFQLISEQHGITLEGKYKGESDLQLQKIHTYFQQQKNGTYSIRSIPVDLNSHTLQDISTSKIKQLYKPQNYVSGQGGAGNSWGRGYYDGCQSLDNFMNVVRREVEACESLQGFQLTHSLGGGTGSGFGSLILENLKEEYCDRLVVVNPIIPSPLVSDCVVEPYNTVLCLNKLIQWADYCAVIDNESLYKINQRLGNKTCTYADLNYYGGNALANMTSCFRYSNQNNSTLLKMQNNLLPFYRLKFLTIGLSPLVPIKHNEKEQKDVALNQIFQLIYNQDNFLSSINPYCGKYISSTAIIRGDVQLKDVYHLLQEFRADCSLEFIQGMNEDISVSLCFVSSKESKLSAASISNNTSIKSRFSFIGKQFDVMFKRKAFLWGLGNGVDEMEYRQAYENLMLLIDEYREQENFA